MIFYLVPIILTKHFGVPIIIMCELDESSFTCESLSDFDEQIKKKCVPTQTQIRQQLGAKLSDVFFEYINSEARAWLGLEPSLAGTDTLWVNPDARLENKVSLTPVPEPTVVYTKALAHNSILDVGEKYIALLENKHRIEMEEALKRQAELLEEKYTRKAAEADDSSNVEGSEECKKVVATLMEHFDGCFNELVESTQLRMRKECEKKIEEEKAELAGYMFAHLKDEVERRDLELCSEFHDILYSELNALACRYTHQINNEREIAVQVIKDTVEKYEKMIQDLKTEMELSSVVDVCRAITQERIDCNARIRNIQTHLRSSQGNVHSVIETLKAQNCTLQKMSTERLKRLMQWRRKVQVLLLEFQRFINFALKSVPGQSEFLLSAEKLMLRRFPEDSFLFPEDYLHFKKCLEGKLPRSDEEEKSQLEYSKEYEEATEDSQFGEEESSEGSCKPCDASIQYQDKTECDLNFDYDQFKSMLVRKFASDLSPCSKGKNKSKAAVCIWKKSKEESVDRSSKLYQLLTLVGECEKEHMAPVDDFLQKRLQMVLKICGDDPEFAKIVLGCLNDNDLKPGYCILWHRQELKKPWRNVRLSKHIPEELQNIQNRKKSFRHPSSRKKKMHFRNFELIYPMATGRRNQYLLVVVFILTGMTFYFLGIHEEIIQKPNMKLFSMDERIVVPGFLVHTPGCRIPDMNPFDKSVLKYVKKDDAFQCGDKPPLIQSNQTSIWVVEEALEFYNVSDGSDLRCCYSEFRRKEVSPATISNIDNSIRFNKNCTSFTDSAHIYNEFIQVKCKIKKKQTYKDFHAFIVPKQKNTSDEANSLEDLSVLIIGADAMSRLNFHRNMPRTKNLMHSLGAVEFFGYNKVQDNTFPNLVPLLSGYSVDEICELCWQNSTSFFDDCPWIWKNFSSKNYFTAFGEDACWMGLFNYVKKGFLNPPTDYYLRPYILANERGIGNTKRLNAFYCDGARFAAEVLFDYAYKFSANMTLSDKRFWGFFWESSLTHDFLNVLPNTDDIFYTLFTNLQRSNVLNTTAVFFLSDHGMRWGSIRETYQGRMEEHLPFLFILLPDWFKERYSSAVKNMDDNTHLLTTHFDVHETMKDLLNLDDIKPERLKSRAAEGRSKRASSLFLPVSIYRSCKSSGIEPTWCTCQRNKEVSATDEKVQAAAAATVNYLNDMLKDTKECAQLKLEKIISAHIEVEEEIITSKTSNVISDYVIILITTPGLAKFEATIRHVSETDEMTVLGGVSRINMYGQQSNCITNNYRLKLYCFCN